MGLGKGMHFLMIMFVIVALCLILSIVGGVFIAKKIWLKLHEIAGISPRTVRYQNSHLLAHHPNQELPVHLQGKVQEQDFSQSALQNAELSEQFQTLNANQNPLLQRTAHQSQASLSKYWHVKHGKVTPLTHLPSMTAEKIHEVPSEALVILDRINDKMARYTVWRAELSDINETWLTEKQYAINRLINESIPEAVNHYDQLARFDPNRVKHTKVNGDMTASDVLIDVLQEVDSQLDSLIDELYQQTVQRLASMHRYVKTRVQ